MMSLFLVIVQVKKIMFQFDQNVNIFLPLLSGSVAVHFLMLSDLTAGLFHKAIMQSGTSLMTCLSQTENPLPQAQLLAERLNITFTDSKDLIRKLQAVPFEDIRAVEAPLFSMGFPWAFRPFEFVPSVEPKSTEGAFLTETPLERLRSGSYMKIPIMIGSPSFEGMFIALAFYSNTSLQSIYNENPWVIVPVQFEIGQDSNDINTAIEELHKIYFDGQETGTLVQWLRVYSDYIFRLSNDRVVRFHAKDSQKKIFYYKFSFEGKINFFKKHLGLENFEGVSHGDELFYLFKPDEDEFKSYVPDDRSNLMIERMTTMWSNFAKYGYEKWWQTRVYDIIIFFSS
jgi:bile salt-stimulated lipase